MPAHAVIANGPPGEHKVAPPIIAAVSIALFAALSLPIRISAAPVTPATVPIIGNAFDAMPANRAPVRPPTFNPAIAFCALLALVAISGYAEPRLRYILSTEFKYLPLVVPPNSAAVSAASPSKFPRGLFR